MFTGIVMISVEPSAVTRIFRFSVVPAERAFGDQVRPPCAAKKRSSLGALSSSNVAGVVESTTTRKAIGHVPVWTSME